MNNLGAALLHKQKQGITTSGVDLHAIQQKINAERQQLLDTINALKAENESLKAGTIKKTPEIKFVFM